MSKRDESSSDRWVANHEGSVNANATDYRPPSPSLSEKEEENLTNIASDPSNSLMSFPDPTPIPSNHEPFGGSPVTMDSRQLPPSSGSASGSLKVKSTAATPKPPPNKIQRFFMKSASIRRRARNFGTSVRQFVSHHPTPKRESDTSSMTSKGDLPSRPASPHTVRSAAEEEYKVRTSFAMSGREIEANFHMPNQSKFQEDGARELVMSRFSEGPPTTSLVSNIGKLGKITVPVGAALLDEDRHLYGQWISTANPTFDSLDCDDAETQVMLEERARRKGHMEPAKWKVFIVLVLIGFVTGVLGLGINAAIKQLADVKFEATAHYLTTRSQTMLRNETANSTAHSDETSVPFAVPTLVYTAINLGYATIAAALVIVGEPLAKGSGIGEIKCYLNGIRLYRVVRFKTLVCKAVGILFSVAAGLPCGREGPMIHSGACIGQGISTAKSSKFHLDTGLWNDFRTDRRKRSFITAGAAAGVGVAFGAPIGGVLFAVEEVGSFWSLELTVMVFIAATVAPWTMQILENPRALSSTVEGLIDFGQIPGEYYYIDLLFVAILGLMGGCMGGAFIKANIVLQRLRKRYIQTRVTKFVEVWIITIMVSVTLMLIITQGFTCKTVTSDLGVDVMNNIRSFGCYKGEYNDAATLYFQSLEATIRILTHTTTHIEVGTLFLHWGPFFVLTVMVYGINVPSGLFLPSLALGASFGRLYAMAWNSMLNEDKLNLGYYSLFGAAAMLGGVTRMTISVIVIIMEATGNTTFFYPLAVILVCAKFSGDLFSHGVYDEVLHFNQIPLLENEMSRGDMSLLSAGDIMNPGIVCISETLTVGELCYVLKTYPSHNCMVVINNAHDCRLRGTLLRRTALMLLSKRAWERDLVFADFTKGSRERVFLKLKKYKFFETISKADRKSVLTLTRYIDQWPHTFTLTTPVSRVYRTFRELGLRHIIITNDERTPVGIIARKQLTSLEMFDVEALSSAEYNKHFGVNSIKAREYHRLLYQHQASHSDSHPLGDDTLRRKVVYGSMGAANEDHFVPTHIVDNSGAVVINPDVITDGEEEEEESAAFTVSRAMDGGAVDSTMSARTGVSMEQRLLAGDESVASARWVNIPDEDWQDSYRPKVN